MTRKVVAAQVDAKGSLNAEYNGYTFNIQPRTFGGVIIVRSSKGTVIGESVGSEVKFKPSEPGTIRISALKKALKVVVDVYTNDSHMSMTAAKNHVEHSLGYARLAKEAQNTIDSLSKLSEEISLRG